MFKTATSIRIERIIYCCLELRLNIDRGIYLFREDTTVLIHRRLDLSHFCNQLCGKKNKQLKYILAIFENSTIEIAQYSVTT